MRYSSPLLISLFVLSGCMPIDELTGDSIDGQDTVSVDVQTDDGQSIEANAALPTEITPQTAVTVAFSAPVPVDTEFSDYLAVSPAIEGDYTLAADQRSVTFTPDPGWQPGVTYRISVSDQVALDNGDTFTDAQWQLAVEDWTDPALIEATDGQATVWNLVTDRWGNVYVAGSVRGTFANNEPQPATDFYGLTPLFYEQGFVQKYSPSGERLWTHLIDARLPDSTSTTHTSAAWDIVIDHNDHLRVMVRVGNDNMTPAQIVALDTDGNTLAGSPWLIDAEVDPELVWVDVMDMAIASDGTLYLYGQTHGSIDGIQSGNLFVAQYSPTGELVWVNQFEATALTDDAYPSLTVWNMTLAEDGSVTLNASTDGDVLGTDPIWDSTTPARNALLIRFDALGNIDWVERFGHNEMALWAGASITAENGDILASYEFFFAPIGATINGTVLNATDGVLLVRYNARGDHLSTTAYANNGGWTGINDLVTTDDNTLVGIGFYQNETTPMENWLTEWDAEGNLFNQRFSADLPTGYDLQLAADPWGQLFMAGTQNDGVLLKRMSFD